MDLIVRMVGEDPDEAKRLIKEMFNDAEAKAEELKNAKAKNRIPLSRQRGADKIPTFSGKGFLAFQKKLIGFAQDEPGCAALLRLVAKKYKDRQIDDMLLSVLADEPDVSDGAPVKVLNSELHSLLGLVTSDIPWSIVDSTEGNGLEAWRLLCREFGAVTSEGKRQILRKILHPTQAKEYKHIRDHETEWNALRAKYKELTNTTIDENILVCAYESVLPAKVVADIRGLKEEFESLKDITDYVRKQVLAYTPPQLTSIIPGKDALNNVDVEKPEEAEKKPADEKTDDETWK